MMTRSFIEGRPLFPREFPDKMGLIGIVVIECDIGKLLIVLRAYLMQCRLETDNPRKENGRDAGMLFEFPFELSLGKLK